jgi:hypothetical protein
MRGIYRKVTRQNAQSVDRCIVHHMMDRIKLWNCGTGSLLDARN